MHLEQTINNEIILRLKNRNSFLLPLKSCQHRLMQKFSDDDDTHAPSALLKAAVLGLRYASTPSIFVFSLLKGSLGL